MCNRLFIKGDKEMYRMERMAIYIHLWTYASNTMWCDYHSNKSLYLSHFELIKTDNNYETI